ncbi:DUF1697 domain-containing protein [Polaribacter sp.]|uniref:DUF1697 domain-containing protein n=1 Tax=Polaribacter sp. TaxID=1920175 RepID=UPI003F6C18A0
MKRYIVLLRGINVSGRNKIPMAELRALLKNLNFYNVQTYIQSGNIILDTTATKYTIQKNISAAILNRFGHTVAVLSRTITEWESAIEHYPFSTENEKIVAFTFLDKPTEIQKIELSTTGEDQYSINGDVVYLYCPSTFAKTKLSNHLFERKLKVTATTRNLRTTLKLLSLAKSSN